MLRRQFAVTNPQGLHARPSGEIAKVAQTFESDITIDAGGGQYCNAKSVIHLVTACVKAGQTVTVQASGPDEAAAMAAVERVLAAQLG